jgi:hypothetical protein
LSILASIGIVAAIATCCICGGAVYQMRPRFEVDREAAVRVTREILPLNVPAVFTPEGVIHWETWMFLTMRGAYYSLNTGEGELSLLEVDSRFMDNPEFREHVVRSLREHGAGGGFNLAVRSVETREFDVSGETVTFTFIEAEDRTSGSSRRLVDGIVPGNNGPVMLSLWVDEELWDPQMVDDMIGSIGAQEPPAD